MKTLNDMLYRVVGNCQILEGLHLLQSSSIMRGLNAETVCGWSISAPLLSTALALGILINDVTTEFDRGLNKTGDMK